MTQRFEGKTVLVTGAAAGIGAAITTRFLQEGATVMATDLKVGNFDAMIAGLDGQLQARMHVLDMDVSSEASVLGAFTAMQALSPRLDVVVNNAGTALMGGVADISFAQWSRLLGVDLNSVFLVSKAALPLLEQSGGNIVNIASISGLFGDHHMAAYNAAKGAVINLTRSLALDYGPVGIRANAVAPGPVRTPLLETVAARNGDVLAQWNGGTPLGRIAEPSDIAAAVAFLASDDARQISGVVLPVDGGFTAKTGQPDLSSGAG